MAYLRITMDIAFPAQPDGIAVMQTTDENGQLVGGIKVSPQLAQDLRDMRIIAKRVRAYARKINDGKPNEEPTVKATMHISHHDDPNHLQPDEDEVDI